MTQSLIRKLRDATSGSAELDVLMLCAVSPDRYQPMGRNPRGVKFKKDNGKTAFLYALSPWSYKTPTRSLDAIIGLIEEKLPGSCWSVMRSGGAFLHRVGPQGDEMARGDHKLAPIALCIALLSALEGES